MQCIIMKYKRYVAYLNIVHWWFCSQSHDSTISRRSITPLLPAIFLQNPFILVNMLVRSRPFCLISLMSTVTLQGQEWLPWLVVIVSHFTAEVAFVSSTFCWKPFIFIFLTFENLILFCVVPTLFSYNDDEGDDKDSVWWILYFYIYIFI